MCKSKKKGVKLFLYSSWRHVGGGGGTVPIIIYLGTRWRCVENCTHRRFAPGKRTLFVLLEQEAGWAPEPVWAFWRREKSVVSI